MKKLGLLIMPVMAIGFLANCNSANVKEFVVSFDSNGGSVVPEQRVKENGQIVPPDNPIKNGYTFKTWCTDEALTNEYDFSSLVTCNLILYAKWSDAIPYTITYHMPDGATQSNPTSYTVESETITLTGATKKGYTFDGWHKDSSTGELITTIPKGSTGDLDLYTSATAIPYVITYHLDGGSVAEANPTTYTVEDKIALNAPTQDGYVFKGWYLAPNEVNPLGGDGWEAGEMSGDITLYADWHVADKTLDANYTWPQISTISGNKEASKYFDVGETKKVQLTHQDLDSDGVIDDNEVYQTVRIIGFNEDYTDLPVDGSDLDSSKAIGITFEFVDLISDSGGYSIATQWNDTNVDSTANHNYLDSSVRAALVGKNQENNHILWAQKGATEWSNKESGPYTDESVLDMLPDELTEEGILKTPAKYINIIDGGWKEEIVKDKLFLLSPVEMGRTGHTDEEPDTTTYSYYKGATDAKRIKKQINATDICTSYSEISSDKGQTFKGTVYNYAGYNSQADETGGGYSWLRSPNASNRSDFAWYVYVDGYLGYHNVYYYVLAVAPAFCI